MKPAARPVTGNYFDKQSVRHPLERRVVAGFNRRLAELVRAAAPRRAIEIGCGDGNVVALVRSLFPDCFYVGVDIDAALLARTAARGANETLLVDPAKPLRLPYPDSSFDLVLLVEVLEHVADPNATLAEAARLAPAAIVSVPFEPWWRLLNLLRLRYVARLGNTPGHVNHWGRGGLRRLLERHLRVDRLNVQFPWLFAAGGSARVTARG
jgi:SAM-dependent methyltransferase